MAVAQQQSSYGRFIIASQSGGSAMFADVSFKCTTIVKEFGKKCARNIPMLHKKKKKKTRHCTILVFMVKKNVFHVGTYLS